MYIKIRNFKTIENAALKLSKVTVLVGPPATGKSNILEAIALLGYPYRLTLRELYGTPQNIKPSLTEIIRFKVIEDLFYFHERRKNINISVTINQKEKLVFNIGFEAGKLVVKLNNLLLPVLQQLLQGSILQSWPQLTGIPIFDARLYGYDRYELTHRIPELFEKPAQLQPKILLSEDASNIVSILNEYNRISIMVNDWFEELGMKIDLRTLSNGKPVVFDYYKEVSPKLLSDTFGRILYYVSALYTCMEYVSVKGINNRVVVLLEEPEAHVFPYSFQLLIKLIEEASNKLYIVLTTHNGGFVSYLWDRIRDIKTYYVYRGKEGSTRIVELDMEKLAKDMVSGSELLVLTPKQVLSKYAKPLQEQD